ncbi:hypothetical protein IPJ72_00725 [Candidatus Peregrinibacteria bacterium]|nr:MAG: hypothetical protein IPJ72_00725 [Candidatus Peregrinibacteria bacterium]
MACPRRYQNRVRNVPRKPASRYSPSARTKLWSRFALFYWQQRFQRSHASHCDRKGYLLNEYGLLDAGEPVAGKTEAEVFKKLEMEFVEPTERN